MHQNSTVRDLEIVDQMSENENFCEGCKFGKQHRRPYPIDHEKERCKIPGELSYSDLCGPMDIQSMGGSLYCVLFKDDCTGFKFVYFIKHKSETFACFKNLLS